MKMTAADVEYVARLARLKGLNTEGIVPTSHAVPMENAFREDVVQPSIGLEKALANAPETAGTFFAVPKVIE